MVNIESRLILKSSKGKDYEVPLKWLVHWLDENSDYESVSQFCVKNTPDDVDRVIKTASKEKIGKYLPRK